MRRRPEQKAVGIMTVWQDNTPSVYSATSECPSWLPIMRLQILQQRDVQF